MTKQEYDELIKRIRDNMIDKSNTQVDIQYSLGYNSGILSAITEIMEYSLDHKEDE